MKLLQKHAYWMVFTLILGALILLGFFVGGDPAQQISPGELLHFQLETDSGTEKITLFQGEDGVYYAFLPSYAEMEDLSAVPTKEDGILLDGTTLTEGMSCGNFALDTDHLLETTVTEPAIVRFRKSANVAAMYINTISGAMDHIHEDKNYEESAAVTLYTPDGTLQLRDGAALVKGRGNASWNYPKKPYALILSGEASLLGMDAASNWVLLANALDESNLRNKIVYDLAGKLSFLWTPECQYVEVYLNGNYNGLYLLTEKLELHKNRLALDTYAGDFLCKNEFEERWTSLRNPFHTQLGRATEITAPAVLDSSDILRIQALVNQLEQVILSGSDFSGNSLIDSASWARKYLLDEVFMNFDADLASSYFCYQNGTFYAGPVWDYDMTLGSALPTQNPQSFYARLYHKYYSSTSPYYSALYGNESFRQLAIQLYKEEFLPLLEQLLNSEMPRLQSEIATAAENNRLRWFPYSSFDSAAAAQQLTAFLSERVSFLNRAWIDDVRFYSVQLQRTSSGFFQNFAIEAGATLDTAAMNMDGTVWRELETGEVFDPSQPITRDWVLVSDQSSQTSFATQDLIAFASIAAFIMLLLCLMAIDVWHRSRERRSENGKERTHVPS